MVFKEVQWIEIMLRDWFVSTVLLFVSHTTHLFIVKLSITTTTTGMCMWMETMPMHFQLGRIVGTIIITTTVGIVHPCISAGRTVIHTTDGVADLDGTMGLVTTTIILTTMDTVLGTIPTTTATIMAITMGIIMESTTLHLHVMFIEVHAAV